MPNWCSTSITIIGPKESLKIIWDEYQKAKRITAVKNDFGQSWLGNLLLHIGVDKDSVCHSDINCRGSVFYEEEDYDHNELRFQAESAWSPCAEVFDKFTRHFMNDAIVYYVSVEPGCEIYLTNDPDYDGCVYVDVYDDGDLPDWISSLQGFMDTKEEYVREYIAKHLNTTDSLEKLIERLNSIVDEKYPNSYVGVHLYKWENI